MLLRKVTIGGNEISYEARAELVEVQAEDGSQHFEMFAVSYSKQGGDASRRPILFAFDGGPGTSSTAMA